MRAFLAMTVMALLVGCASEPAVPTPRVETFAASPDRVLQATMATLAAQGFVITHGDQTLGRLDAEYASRPPWWIRAAVEAAGTGSQLELIGRRGGSVLAPRDFDSLVMTLQNRLASGATP